ncbi:PD-(D/E)XK nuclease family protein [Halopenitus sp. H-Gu1]|uniref:PD-(D/E)XK nuclease family protein n=1 Tax=Halopenitus sp. H-Gu1 TaxID=3242697 RepID=UPI00359E717E
MTDEFIYGPAYEPLQTHAFESADAIADDAPTSILWLERNDHRMDQVADAWARDRDPLRLEVTGLDQLVGECYEALTGPRTLLDALTRRQLVDEALRTLENDHVLDDAHRHRDAVLDVVTTLEADGYDTTDAIESLLAESTVPDRAAEVLETTYDRFADDRSRTMTGEEYIQSQAYRRVLEADDSMADLLPHADVVVVSGYYDLSTNQRAIIDRLADSIPSITLLPLVNDRPNAGADAVAADAAAFYREHADDIRHVTPDQPAPLVGPASRLYTPGDDSDYELTEGVLRWVQAPTPDREIRRVARSLRKRLADDEVDPNDVLVVVPGLISYREHVEDLIPAHGVETVSVANKLLYQTNVGTAMLDLVTACKGDPGAELLARLATNPTVRLDGVDGAEVADLARRLPTDDHERLLTELDDDSRTTVEELLTVTDRVTDAAGVATLDALRTLFDHVALETNVETINEEAETFDAEMESRAYSRVDRVLDAIERVVRTLEVDEVFGRVSNELDQVRVPPPRNATDGAIEVVGPRDAFMQSYDHLYLVGMTTRDSPPNQDRPRFFEELEDGLTGVDATTDREVARYQFATMLASANSVFITTPRSTVDDDPLLESALLDELTRVTDLEPTDHDLGNGYREDVQRAVGRTSDSRAASDAVEQAHGAGVFDDDVMTRVRRGVRCAEHRREPTRTEHDGLLDPETVDALHPPDEREPYSPTRLTQYARCGFRYYMERVLDIEAPEEYKLEPDPLDLGSLVHAILEGFYTDLQDTPGDPVDLATHDPVDLEARMVAAGERALAEQVLPFDDTFYDRWLRALFAGLADPERNDYYHADEAGIHAPSRGLLGRFLDAERDRDDDPGWFEVGMDLSDDEDATFDLELPDGRTVPIGGRIDRVTVDRTDEPATGLVHDYKTGDRSPRSTIDGIEFQLPLYALAAGHQLEREGVETPLDAAFYVLDPPDDVSEKWTLRYYLSRYGDATDEDYERFIEAVTPRRVRSIVDGIEGGAFEPTVLDEDTAKCQYCEYSDICDVRYHQRRAVVDAIDADDRPGYVPRYAREESLLDQFGGGDR